MGLDKISLHFPEEGSSLAVQGYPKYPYSLKPYTANPKTSNTAQLLDPRPSHLNLIIGICED